MSKAEQQSIEPLLVLGEQRQYMLQRVLSTPVESWCQRWAAAGNAVASVAGPPERGMDCSAHRAGVALEATSAAHGVLMHLYASSNVLAALLGISSFGIGGASDSSGSLAHELAHEVLHSLCIELLKAAAIEDPVIHDAAIDAAPVDERRSATGVSRSHWISLSIGPSRAEIALKLSSRFVELLAPRKRPDEISEALARRRAAIAQQRVHVEAILGNVEVPLRDLVRLIEGDVVVLDQQLSGVGHLLMRDGMHVANILFGSAGARRAISITK